LYRSIVSQSSEFAAITLCVASQRVFIVTFIYLVIDSGRNLLDALSYTTVECKVYTLGFGGREGEAGLQTH